MSENPLFSVITVTKNNLAGLRRTATSLKSQSFQLFEWIVADGGSQDGSSEFLKDVNARWSSESDGGLYDAMNKGMAKAKGEYLIFLNAGDALAGPGVLDILSRSIRAQKHTPDFLYGDSLEGESLAYKPARRPALIGWGMFTHHQSMLYRRAALGGLKYRQDYSIAADYDFTLRFLQDARRVLYCPAPICVFETGGVSQRGAREGRAQQFLIRRDLKCAPLKNAAIYAAQTAAWSFRRAMPRLYWLWKSSGNRPRGFARI